MKKEFMFSEKIECWEDWGKVYHSIPAFCGDIGKGQTGRILRSRCLTEY